MKKIICLLFLIPLATIAADAEHGGKPMQTKAPAQQTSEHGGKAMESKEQADRMGEQAGRISAHGRQPMEKKASEHAGSPVE